MPNKRLFSLIPKQLEKLVLGFVGFSSKFLSSLVPCLSAMVTRSGQKFRGTSLPNSQLFKLFGYLLLLALSGCAPRHHHHHRLPPPSYEKVVKETKPKKRVWIMLDPGHGGEDFGTRSLTPPRHQEKFLNLATSYMVKDFLQEKGYETTLTRQKDVFLSLEQRASLANKEKPTLFVSVHYNAAPSTQAEGVEVYYFRSAEDKARTAESKKLAEMVLAKILFKTKAKSRGVKHGDFAVIRETKMPAILVEGGFLSNEEEMEKLRDPMYLKRVAWGIAEGIDQYLKNVLGAN